MNIDTYRNTERNEYLAVPTGTIIKGLSIDNVDISKFRLWRKDCNLNKFLFKEKDILFFKDNGYLIYENTVMFTESEITEDEMKARIDKV